MYNKKGALSAFSISYDFTIRFKSSLVASA